jgi:predicted Zn-dependent protease
MRFPTLCLLLLSLALTACGSAVKNPVTGREERSVMDEPAEVAEGRKAHQAVLQAYGVYGDARLQAYVNGVGQRLAQQSHRPTLAWTFTVLDSPEVNAFALPGGFVYITRGIMAYLDSEADLAGVLGHEIGHVTARHGAQRATRQQNAGLGVLAATVLGVVLEGAGVGGAAQAAGQLSQGVAAGYIASYSRDQELQADQLGAEYLHRTQYDPRNMIDVIRVLKNQELFAQDVARTEGRAVQGGGGGNWLSSHPSSDRRLQEISDIATRLQAQAAGRLGDDGRVRYLQAINGMAFGESRSQGLTRGRHFLHEELGFAITAPPGWKFQNRPEVLVVVNAAGDAGLMARLLPADFGTDHDRILRDRLKAEQGRVERLTLGGGLAATHFVGQRRTEQGALAPIDVTLVTGPGQRPYLLQYAASDANAQQRAQAGLREAALSFRVLNAADRAAAKPWVLRSVPMPRGGFAQLVRSSPLTEHSEQQLRLLNASGGSEPAPGTLIKTVE